MNQFFETNINQGNYCEEDKKIFHINTRPSDFSNNKRRKTLFDFSQSAFNKNSNNEILNTSKNNNNRNIQAKISPIKFLKKTPPKKNIKSAKKKTQKQLNISYKKENDKDKLFCICMNHYGKNFSGKKPYDINQNEITEMGQIYYILKFNIYERFIKNEKNNENKYYSKVNEFVECLSKNKKISEEIFIDFGEGHELSQLVRDISQKIKIISQDSDIIMESKNDEIVQKDFIKNCCFNKIKKENLCRYDLLLFLKGKFVGGDDKYSDWDNFQVLSQNLRGYEINDNKGDKKDYFVQFKIGEKYLKKMKIRNDEKLTNINYKEFEEIMKNIKIGEEVIFVFLYNPSNYFDINLNLYKLGINECESIIFIDCSKKNTFLNNIFDYIRE